MDNNIKLNSLVNKNFQVKKNESVILKPLSEIAGENNPGINKDSFQQKFIPVKVKLINPIQLFHDENTTVIEPGASAENIKAIKQIPGKQWLGKLASNGNREAAVIIPEGVDYNKPFELIYYFHGHDNNLSKCLTDVNYGLKDQIKNLAKDRNIIVVVPQGPSNSLDYTWMNGKNNEDMEQFENDTMNIIKTKLAPEAKISSITIKGHSAGGRPIMNSAKEGKLKADRIDFMDASYGSWASQAYNSFITKNPEAKFNLIYIPGSNSGTQADALSLEGKKGVHLIQSKVNHSSVPKQFFSI